MYMYVVVVIKKHIRFNRNSHGIRAFRYLVPLTLHFLVLSWYLRLTAHNPIGGVVEINKRIFFLHSQVISTIPLVDMLCLHHLIGEIDWSSVPKPPVTDLWSYFSSSFCSESTRSTTQTPALIYSTRSALQQMSPLFSTHNSTLHLCFYTAFLHFQYSCSWILKLYLHCFSTFCCHLKSSHLMNSCMSFWLRTSYQVVKKH